MPDSGVCDQCNDWMSKGDGYSFFSSASVGMIGMQQLTGNMLLCEDCTNKIITAENWRKTIPKQRELTGADILANPMALLNTMRSVNADSIVQNCKKHGFTPEQAKERARDFGRRWWDAPEETQRESAKFWTAAAPARQPPVATVHSGNLSSPAVGDVRSLWMVWSFFPFLAWVAWVHASIRARRPAYLLFAAGYFLLILPLFILSPDPADKKASEAFKLSTAYKVISSLIGLSWIGGICHSVLARKTVTLRIKDAAAVTSKTDAELESKVAAENGMEPSEPLRDVTGTPLMNKKMLALLKRLETSKTTRDALQFFEREFVPLGPDALQAFPHLFRKLSTLPGYPVGNGLIDLCYDGFVKLPGSFGEQGHSVAVTNMLQEVPRASKMIYTHLGSIVRAVCGSVKRGAKGEGVLRALEEFKSWLASVSPDQQFEAGSKEDNFIRGLQREWQTELTKAIQDIKTTAAPDVSSLPASVHGKPTVSAPEKVQHLPPTGSRSVQMDAPAADPSKGLDTLGKLSVVCECGQRGAVKAEYAGRTMKCPRCQRKIQVPSGENS